MRFIPILIFVSAAFSHAQPKPPLRALLIAGGCCHDYATQALVLRDGIQAKANVQVDVLRADDNSTSPRFEMFESADWAEGYDVIIHDECAADVKDLDYLANILAPHKAGLPVVNLHCAMHSYRTGTPDWFEFLGLQSTSHGPQKPIEIDFTVAEHAITAGLENWTTENEELYNNVKVFETATPLAIGSQDRPDGSKDTAVVAWINDYHGTRTFSTTIGHNTVTVGDARYLELVVRGLLWATDKLGDEEYRKPYAGPAGLFILEPKHVAKAGPAKEKPDNATVVKASASSEEADKGNFAWKALNGDENNRWCANGHTFPQWLQIEFEKAVSPAKLEITWEQGNTIYRHKVEGSADGKEWALLVDAQTGDVKGRNEHALQAKDIRFIRITCTGTTGGWASIKNIKVTGDGIGPLYSELAGHADEKSTDRYAKSGNIRPRIQKLSAEEEAAILKDVKVADGFDVSLFATASAANYPVFVAAAPNGDVYVASDGNGSLGRNPHRGRIVRLRDTTGDGRADQVTPFVKDLDSPRGLVWDHDRLYVVHPPHISAFIDHDGDGQADEEKRLIDNIAFGFKDRPADHTTNGLSMGIDGWLYISVGDFGFLEASGTDGRKLQMRGGGIVRFRPDGSGLETFADGTRNIVGSPISPLLDLFTRDNTNDGGGWDVRFHHFTGLTDHGYPRLYIHFSDEIISPLADYGGGSGCGAVYLSEPGFPSEWNHAPLTCDWGTGGLWRHKLRPKGATFEEIEKPAALVRMTRPTDAAVDGMSAIYQASWKGATFDWAGPDAGYIVRVTPSGYRPEPLPDFDKESDERLVELLASPSHIRSLEAQRALLRREESAATRKALLDLARDTARPLPARVAALYAVTQRALKAEAAEPVISAVVPLAADASIQRFVLRALGDGGLDRLAAGGGTAPAALYENGLKSDDARTRLEAVIGAARQNLKNLSPAVARQLGSDDAVIGHTAFRALAMLGGSDACFAVLDSDEATPAARQGALFALMRMHDPKVISGLIERLGATSDSAKRRGLLAAICRLHSVDGEWKGDSWGTRPDTRGPYYQPEPWSGTPQVAAFLEDALANANGDEAAYLVAEMSRNRIESTKALDRILALAREDARHLPEAVSQLSIAKTIPAAAIPLLVSVARGDADATTLSKAVVTLVKTDSAEAWEAALDGLAAMDKKPEEGKSREVTSAAFLGSQKLENHHQLLERVAERLEGDVSRWAEAGLLALSAAKSGSPEAKELSARALERGWQGPKRRLQILQAIHATNFQGMNDKVLAAMDDADSAVAAAAGEAAKRLKLEKKPAEQAPMVSTMKTEEVVKAVLATKGDVALGEQVYNRQTCVACHTTSQEQDLKGPYLGNIAQTYTRADLTVSILEPDKDIAQGFATEVFTLKDGSAHMGFVTLESAEQVKIRDITSKEYSFRVDQIEKRQKMPNSMMPAGLVNNLTIRELASLLDYLEELAKK
jgi:putative membrane-bound dehydrogenase-like protein